MNSITAVWKENIRSDRNQAATTQKSTTCSKKQRTRKNICLWIWRVSTRTVSTIWLLITRNHSQSKRRKTSNQLPLSTSQPLPASITSTILASPSLPSQVTSYNQKRRSTISASTLSSSKQDEAWCCLVWSPTIKTQLPASNLPTSPAKALPTKRPRCRPGEERSAKRPSSCSDGQRTILNKTTSWESDQSLPYFSVQYTITTCSNQDRSILAQSPGRHSEFPQLQLACPLAPFALRLLQLPASVNLTPTPCLKCFDSWGRVSFEWSKGANSAWPPCRSRLGIGRTKRQCQ